MLVGYKITDAVDQIRSLVKELSVMSGFSRTVET